MTLSKDGIALQCDCGAVTLIRFSLPDPLPPDGTQDEVAATCGSCGRTQWMTLTIRAR